MIKTKMNFGDILDLKTVVRYDESKQYKISVKYTNTILTNDGNSRTNVIEKVIDTKDKQIEFWKSLYNKDNISKEVYCCFGIDGSKLFLMCTDIEYITYSVSIIIMEM